MERPAFSSKSDLTVVVVFDGSSHKCRLPNSKFHFGEIKCPIVTFIPELRHADNWQLRNPSPCGKRVRPLLFRRWASCSL